MKRRHDGSGRKKNNFQGRRRRLPFASKALLGTVVATVVIMAVNLSVSPQAPPSQGPDSSSFRSKNIHRITSETMSSCILIMDDNHWLVEWLAYHWTTLNLRHMIIAIDPRSKTSPISILDRWKGRLNFELWNDSHYFDNVPGPTADLQEVNLARQQTFLAKCMGELKRRNHSWTMFTDTDEFVVINPRTNRKGHALYREYSPPIDTPGSILSFLQNELKTRNTTCFSMGRLQFSPDESSLHEIQKNVPLYFNSSQFMTLRWLHPADDLVGPKNIIDLSSMDVSVIPTNYTHQHRVIYEKCPEAGHTWHRANSLLQVYHYLGTLEQHNFRNDARLSLEWAGRNERYERYKGEGVGTRDDLRPWLKAFVKSVGKEEAIRLLEGVGRTEGWETADAHELRFAAEPCCVMTVDVNVPGTGNTKDENIDGNDDDSTGSQDSSKKKVFYSTAKTDRSGAAVADMLLAHAYGFANHMTYAGACAADDLPYRKKTEELLQAVGLQDVLVYACPEKGDSKAAILDRQVYVAENTRIFTSSYLKHLHARVKYPTTKNHTVVIHIRRGDVTPCSYYANRYLPNSHYVQILKEYVPPELPVSIFSELDAFESFDDFANYSLYLDTVLSDAWKAMITADYIVLSKSSFSMVPAILNRNATVIYTPFMQKGLPQWTAVSDDIMKNTKRRVLELIEQRCSPEEKNVALRKIS